MESRNKLALRTALLSRITNVLMPVEKGHEISHLAKDLIMSRIEAIANVHIHIEPHYKKN